MFTSNKLNAYIPISVDMQIISHPGLRRDSNSSPTHFFFSQFKPTYAYYPPTICSRHFPSHIREPYNEQDSTKIIIQKEGSGSINLLIYLTNNY